MISLVKYDNMQLMIYVFCYLLYLFHMYPVLCPLLFVFLYCAVSVIGYLTVDSAHS